MKKIMLLSVLLCFGFALTADAAIPADAVTFSGHSYKVYTGIEGIETWDQAKAYCESQGGHLVSVGSQEENDFLYQYILSKGIKTAYLGLSESGGWRWVTGEEVKYTNWFPGEPNSSSEAYAQFYWKFNDGTWNDGNFGHGTQSDERNFICEWEPSAAVVPKTSPSSDPDPKQDDPYTDYTGEGDKPLSKDVKTVDKTITTSKSDEVKGASFPLLQARAVNVKRTSFKLKWNALPKAAKYLIYGNRCGKKNKYEYITSTKKTYYKAKKLKKKKFYKYVVVAVKGSKVISVSKTVHVGLKDRPNPTKVTVNKKTVKLILGSNLSTFQLKCSVKGTNLKQHRKVAYETDNVKVAKVTKKGLIKAAGTGKCNIFAYAQNGVFAKIKVTVLN